MSDAQSEFSNLHSVPVFKVLHIIGSLNRGGAETVALNLVQEISSSEVIQIFAPLTSDPGELDNDFRSAGAVVAPVPLSPGLSFPRRLSLLIQSVRPDCVVSHVSLASGPILAIARLLGVPLRIARFHSESDGRSSAARTVYRALMRALVVGSATHVYGVTRGSLEFGLGKAGWTAKVLGVDVGVLANGVNPNVFTMSALSAPGEGETGVVIYVGRAAPEKNRQILPGIISSLNDTRPAELRVFGSSDTDDLGSGHVRLRIMGSTTNVAGELRKAHVLVLCSTWEGLPGVVLEALSCGVPVVASDLAGIREIAQECSGVTLVPADSTVDEWAYALSNAMDISGRERRAIRQSLLGSRFTFMESVRNWRALWTH